MSGNAGAQPAGWYLASIASFMIPAGIQTVLLPYLLAIELNQPAARFGATQMMGQLPTLVFLLFGGWLADRIEPRRLLMGLHTIAMVVPLLLAWLLWRKQLSEASLLIYALSWGLVSAFAMPARDGVLKRVAGSNVQRMVTLAVGTQMATQLVGQALGGLASHWGAISLLLIQCLVLLSGIQAARRLPAAIAQPAATAAGAARESLWRSFGGGLSIVIADVPMRAALLLTLGMGVFFTGVMTVLIPLTVRDAYSGGAQDIATAFVMVGSGTVVTLVLLSRRGGLLYPVRAMGIALLSGCIALSPLLLAPPLWVFYGCIFLWGMGGGVVMSMSRTVLQEHAPATHQSRVMALLSLSVAGSNPISSLILGLAVSGVGVRWAVVLPLLGVATMTVSILLTHPIWQLRTRSR